MHPSEIKPGMVVTINSSSDLMFESHTRKYITNKNDLRVHQVVHLTKSGLVYIQVGPKEYITVPASNVDFWDEEDYNNRVKVRNDFILKFNRLIGSNE